jgi:hypothetical protein
VSIDERLAMSEHCVLTASPGSRAKKSGDAREEEGATANYREPREEEGISELGASGPCGPSADNSKIAACCRCTMLFVRNAAMQKVHEYH